MANTPVLPTDLQNPTDPLAGTSPPPLRTWAPTPRVTRFSGAVHPGGTSCLRCACRFAWGRWALPGEGGLVMAAQSSASSSRFTCSPFSSSSPPTGPSPNRHSLTPSTPPFSTVEDGSASGIMPFTAIAVAFSATTTNSALDTRIPFTHVFGRASLPGGLPSIPVFVPRAYGLLPPRQSA
ncbi:hypothetical protein FIBSPDRAFT_963956 [Athelia psychrophila]|uniref:Uncharacterized protein n=1 Tax=Athelia psychrophila TaxID=1759441 RepID=A0A165YBZ2_9AGAM|nr:hypothetical protein FIBSPDRAFT_963956 [Fibularhizoctonia sp. CBS 109695]